MIVKMYIENINPPFKQGSWSLGNLAPVQLANWHPIETNYCLPYCLQ